MPAEAVLECNGTASCVAAACAGSQAWLPLFAVAKHCNTASLDLHQLLGIPAITLPPPLSSSMCPIHLTLTLTAGRQH